jgi:monofunctional biosynthetic peptidoglycan transglycosylase
MRFSIKLLPERVQGWRRWLLAAGLVLAALIVLWAGWTIATWPDVGALKHRNPSSTAFIERHGHAERAAGRSGDVRWSWTQWDEISPLLKKAVLVAEDTEFFSHEGFSTHETREAIRQAVERREAPRGASTITQQLAKNLWLSPERSLSRKLREAILTMQLERRLEKRRILELYLNVVEFGPAVYGAEAGARYYFGKSASRLTEEEAAMMAAGLTRSTWHPASDSRHYRLNVERVRDLMAQLTYLDRYVGLATRPSGPDSIAPPDLTAVSDSAGSTEATSEPE